jgi:hypothetical protein
MSPEYQEYYQQLLATIESHQVSDYPEMEKIEACFKSSLDFWGTIRREVKKQDFGNTAEEIHFFKTVKPLFTSHIEYYTYCYHALLFLPDSDPMEQKRFWKWEMRKIERFRENNQEFCQYIRQGATHRDTEFFVRSSNITTRARKPQGLVHDLDEEMTTSHDHLLTIIGAYDLYEKHIQTKIEKPGGYIFFTK